MKYLVFLVLPFFFIHEAAAKGRNYKFGKLEKTDKLLSVCPYDSTANAVYLFDQGDITYFSGGLNIYRHFRIKMLNDQGLGYADITIPYYAEDNIEKITKVKGMIYYPDASGEWQSKELEKDQINTVDKKNGYNEMRISFPNAKAGAIIELEYKKLSSNITFLDDWYFQYEIPVLYSSLDVTVPKGTFHFNFFLHGARISEKYAGEPSNFWEIENLPALRDEPFVYALEDYRESIKFQLGGYRVYKELGGTEDVEMETWDGLAERVKKVTSFIDFHDRKSKAKRELEAVLLEGDPNTKAMQIYDYFVNQYTWNGDYSLFPDQRFKDFELTNKGSSAELNIYLYNLYRAADFDVALAYISTRGHGRINPNMPLLTQFNHTIVALKLNGKNVYIDGTIPSMPFGVLDENCLNIYAYILDDKAHVEEMKDFEPAGASYQVGAELDGDKLVYNYQSMLTGQMAAYARKKFHDPDYSEGLIGISKDKALVKHEVDFENLDDRNKKLLFKGLLHQEVNSQQDMLYLVPYLNDQFTENPFKEKERNCHIELPYEQKIKYIFNFKVPENWNVIEMPKSESFVLNGRVAEFKYLAQEHDGFASILVTIQFNSRFIHKKEYLSVNKLYELMVEKLQEPIVLQKS